MKNKYKTGNYMVFLFDAHGTKQTSFNAINYTKAMEKGKDKTSKPPYASFVVTRVVHNSLDRADPWEHRQ